MFMRSALLISVAALSGCGVKDIKSPPVEEIKKSASLSGCSSNAEGNLVVCGGSQDFIDREITPYFGELKPMKIPDSEDNGLPPYANRLNENGDIPFVEHDFGAHCFNTWGCRVEYAGRVQVDTAFDVLTAPFTETTTLNEATQKRVKNFPPAARVKWKSRDGTEHLAHVELDKIFWERRFLHHMYVKDIRSDEAMPNPRIDIVVNDRRLTVYMGALIKLKRTVNHEGIRSENSYDPKIVEGVTAYEKYF